MFKLFPVVNTTFIINFINSTQFIVCLTLRHSFYIWSYLKVSISKIHIVVSLVVYSVTRVSEIDCIVSLNGVDCRRSSSDP